MNVLFIQTGGTIDKDYPQGETHHGYGFQISEPAFLSILKRARLKNQFEYHTLVRKDSLDMTDEDRSRIREYVAASSARKVIITHGTDTIFLTAKVLSVIPRKTIILTGAMLPEKFRDSDADFNLGMAVAAAHFLPVGVYIALYGEVKIFHDFVPQ